MKLEFDPATFINRIGKRLVTEFDEASEAGTPGLIGSAREHPARKQLEKLMPAYVAIGTGIIMDTFGNRGNQQDIVLYERDFCPVYSINDAPDATYFPVEGVIAVGEIKSTVDRGILLDALGKIKEAKKLKKFSEKVESGLGVKCADYRHFGNGMTLAATPETEFDQKTKFRDCVFGFILCGSFKYSGKSVAENIVEFGRKEGFQYLPNFVASLEDGFIQNVNMSTMSLQHSASTSDATAFCPEKPRAFSFLVHELARHSREGRSVPLHALDRYMTSNLSPLPSSEIVPYK